MMNIYLKKIDYNNKKLLNNILTWRNDENTRKFSNNSNIITEDIFNIIIEKYKESTIDPLIIYKNENDNEIGILSFVKNNDKIYIGINIDPEYRNKKIGSIALELFISNKNIYIKNDFNLFDNKLYAIVKKINESSIKLFNKFFKINNENEYNIEFFIELFQMKEKLIIGTVQFGLDYGITNNNGKIDSKQLDNIFDFCNNNNIIYFDTAQDYGNSEDILSKYKYENFNIITKCKFKNKDIENTLQISFNKFNIIECFMLHSFEDYKNKDIINKLLYYKNLNKIKKIGVSIYNVEEAIELLNDNIINVIQIPFNYLDNQWFNIEFQELVNMNKKNNSKNIIEIHVRSIFLQGILLNPIIKYPNNIDINEFNNLNMIINEVTTKLNLSKIELCFAYINSFNWIDKFLIGIDNYEHLILNYNIINKNLKLNDEEIFYIKNKFKNINSLLYSPTKWIFN
jgi:aryl-alcohol dehydrogenase-like predicted oxidoreductase